MKTIPRATAARLLGGTALAVGLLLAGAGLGRRFGRETPGETVQPPVATVASVPAVRPQSRTPPPELVLQIGHQSTPVAMAVSPDGARLAVSDESGAVLLWNLATGRQLAEFSGAGLYPLAFSPDGNLLLVDTTLRDARSGSVLRRFAVPGTAYCAAFSPDGRHVALGGGASERDLAEKRPDDGWLALFATGSAQPIATRTNFSGRMKSIVFAPGGGEVLALSAASPSIAVIDAATGAAVRSIPVAIPAVDFQTPRVLAIAPDGARVLAAAGSAAQIREFSSGRLEREFGFGGPAVLNAAFTPDGEAIAAALADDGNADSGYAGSVQLWDIATGTPAATLTTKLGCRRPQAFLGFSPDGTELYASSFFSGGGWTRYLSRVTGPTPEESASHLKRWQWPGRTPRTSLPLRAHAFQAQTSPGFSSDGKRFFGNAFDDHPGWDLEAARSLTPAEQPVVPRWEIETHGGDSVVYHGARFATRREIRRLAGAGGVSAVTTDGRLAATTTGAAEITLWNVSDGAASATCRGHEHPVRQLQFVAGGARLFSSDDETGRIWDTATGRELQRLPFIDRATIAARRAGWSQFSGDLAVASEGGARVATKRYVAAGGQAGHCEVALWEVATGEARPFPLRLPSGYNRIDLDFSPDGRRLAVTSEGAVHLTDAATAQIVATLSAEPHKIRGVQFAPDGGRVMTYLSNGTLALWSGDGGFLAQLAVDETGEWVIVTDRGFFTGSAEGRRFIGWRIADAVFPVELFGQLYERPQLVAQELMGSAAPAERSKPTAHRPPALELTIDVITAQAARVHALATPAAPGGKIQAARIYIDGREATLTGAKAPQREERPDGRVLFRSEVVFPPGKTMAVVAAVAVDEAGVQSLPATLRIVRPGPTTLVERTLVALSVGVSRYARPEANLNYADADALGLADALRRQEGQAYIRVLVRTLTNEEATRDGIRDALRWLQAQAGPATSAIVAFSGHGGVDRGGRLYYVPHDADGRPDQTWLPWDEVAAALRQVRASPVIFFSDCCHAGAFGQRPAAQESLADPLVRGAGVMVFAASRGLESSLELGSLEHGAFTYALLQGLEGRADLIPDGRITMSELQAYVANQVKQLTDDRQHPHVPLMNDFDPETVIAYVRARASAPPPAANRFAARVSPAADPPGGVSAPGSSSHPRSRHALADQ